jgi:sigma-B regulation protein RsbU (phosphoserine phosphatase)
MAVKSLKRAQERIEVKDLKLNAILDVTLAINSNVSKKELFEIYENVLKQLNIEKLVLFINDSQWKKVLSYGLEDQKIEVSVDKDLLEYEDISEVNSITEGPLSGFDLVVPVYHKTKPIAYLLIGDTINESIRISPIIKHLNFIQTFTNIISVAIENKRLAKEEIQQERTKKELELASQMQSMLLPNHLPQNEHLEISAYYQSHQKVGGDYYDVIWLDENRICFCIADVSGKGISAAILMSNFQASVRVLAETSDTLEEFVRKLNTKVIDSAQGDRFITMFVGVFDIAKSELRYVNCGHNPPILKNGEDIEYLKLGSPGLGMLDEIPVVKMGTVHLKDNSILVCYTDGLSEVENEQMEEFGTDRIVDAITAASNTSMKELNSNLITSLDTFRGQNNYIDDIAIVSCRFH